MKEALERLFSSSQQMCPLQPRLLEIHISVSGHVRRGFEEKEKRMGKIIEFERKKGRRFLP